MVKNAASVASARIAALDGNAVVIAPQKNLFVGIRPLILGG